MFKNILDTYWDRLRSFHPNARLYLCGTILTGAAFGIYRLLFNFFVLSLGFDEAFLGLLVTTNSMTALIAALPMGYFSDVFGRKHSLIAGGLLTVLTVIGMVIFPIRPVFLALSIMLGLAQSLSGVTMGPFLMENSHDKERTYLFSLASGFQMASAFTGNWLGGYLPGWVANLRGVAATNPEAYGGALLAIAGLAIAGVIPLLFLRASRVSNARSVFAPVAYFRQQPVLLGKLILPVLVTSIGAGLFMPFMNIFFRQVHHQPDPAIGSLFAWGSLAMGVGLMIAPPLAERFGKIKLIVITQGLSIPFLALLGFTPWFAASAGAYYVRLALMNMTGPIYQTFVMERVEADARGTVASLVSMANNFGWAFSPMLSGYLQVHYGFNPIFALTLILYALTVYLYWKFFWHGALNVSARPVRNGVV